MMAENPNRCRHCGNAPTISCITTPDDFEEWSIRCDGCAKGPNEVYETREDAMQAWRKFNSPETE